MLFITDSCLEIHSYIQKDQGFENIKFQRLRERALVSGPSL